MHKLLILLIFSLSIFGNDCVIKIKAVSDGIPRLRIELINDISTYLETESFRLEDLSNLFNSLKKEEEIFLDIYTNRSSLKREFTEEEVEQIRASFTQLTLPENLDAEEIQTIYSNELQNLLISIDQSYRVLMAREQLDSLEETELKTRLQLYEPKAIRLMKVFILMGLQSPTDPVKTIGQSQAMEVFNSYQRVSLIDLEFIARALDAGDRYPNFEVLSESSLGTRLIEIEENYKSEFENFCCSSNPGCTLCPNNLRYR